MNNRFHTEDQYRFSTLKSPSANGFHGGLVIARSRYLYRWLFKVWSEKCDRFSRPKKESFPPKSIVDLPSHKDRWRYEPSKCRTTIPRRADECVRRGDEWPAVRGDRRFRPKSRTIRPGRSSFDFRRTSHEVREEAKVKAYEELKDFTAEWLKELAGRSTTPAQKKNLSPRYQKCMELNDDHVEKLWNTYL